MPHQTDQAPDNDFKMCIRGVGAYAPKKCAPSASGDEPHRGRGRPRKHEPLRAEPCQLL